MNPHHDSARFFAQIIYAHIAALPDGCADQLVDVQMALDLSDAEFELGLRYCVENRLIEVNLPDTQSKPH